MNSGVLSFNLEGTPVEGMTNPLWILIFARDGLVLPKAIWGPPTPKTLGRLTQAQAPFVPVPP